MFIRVHPWLFLLTATLLAQDAPPPTYALGVDDQIMVKALDAEEVSTAQPLRIDSRGNVTLPMVGRIHAAGLTTEELSDLLEQKLKKYLTHPDVTVYLVDVRKEPVSVMGAVQTPGVQLFSGHKTLFEAISAAGGIRQDAGYTIKITRRLDQGPIPLPDAKSDPSNHFSIGSVNIKGVMDAANPAENIEIRPNDVISVPKGQLIYVIGAVHKPGGFVLGEVDHMTALQLLSLSEGLDHFADSRHAKIMRPVPGSDTRTEIPIDLKALLDGKGKDLPLQANDLLFVPNSGKKAAAAQAMNTALGLTSVALYRIP